MRYSDEPSTAELKEEIRQLRTAVSAVTNLAQGLYLQMLRHDLAPVPEMSRWVGNLRLYVTDHEMRAKWEELREQHMPDIAAAAKRQHPD